MAEIAQLKQALQERFPFLAEAIRTPRERRAFVEAPADRFREVFEHAVKELGFGHLATISGTDEKESLGALYHLARADGTLLNLKLRVPREAPAIRTVTDLFPGAANYERELADLLGFAVEGLPPGKRYPMPDDFPTDQHPLRKDWKPAQ